MMDTWLSRLRKEHDDLDERLGKLGLFLRSEQFEHLPTGEKLLLESQAFAMSQYRAILKQRLEMACHRGEQAV